MPISDCGLRIGEEGKTAEDAEDAEGRSPKSEIGNPKSVRAEDAAVCSAGIGVV